ncbi:MAG: virulence factor SrfB, partial [Gammaproteobacteria bacterium]|nr:virulence factor SrfB [Gammaproteobacteria bacterium]
LLLDAVAQGCSIPRLRLVDTLTEAIQTPPVDVDLVIDVGNSRTCGILIEQPKDQGPVDITQAYRLELRDLSRPHQTYADPFESRVEFAPAQFGRADHSRNSGRPQRDAFWWPSPVRVGPEAAWLASLADGTEGVSGLSSPKRYLWDTAPRVQPWTNSRGLLPVTRPVPAISGPMTALLTEEGDPVDPTRPDSFVGMLPRYSRSSLYSLMLGELLIHAVNQINSIAVRERRPNSDLPRRLRQIILTLPSATPLAEQKILRRRAAAAVDLVWKTMGWDAAHKPRLKLDWDEATCTHLVYLYNEINHKYRGNPRDLFERIGRTAPSGAPAVRIASLDLGGGTSDLMIIQHEIDAGGQFTVHPRPLFREGFRQAGDDIVKVVVEDCVLPALAEAMQAAGVAQPTALLADLLGGDHERMGQQERAMRSLLNQQLFVPAAYALLLAYEQTDPRHPQAPRTLVYGDILRTAPPSPAVTGFLESRIQRAGGNGFVLADVLLRMDEGQMAGAVLSVIRGMVEDLCDVIRQYDCDLLLLTGRPSRLPALRELVCANLPVTNSCWLSRLRMARSCCPMRSWSPPSRSASKAVGWATP